jgi:hypothetical protein
MSGEVVPVVFVLVLLLLFAVFVVVLEFRLRISRRDRDRAIEARKREYRIARLEYDLGLTDERPVMSARERVWR